MLPSWNGNFFRKSFQLGEFVPTWQIGTKNVFGRLCEIKVTFLLEKACYSRKKMFSYTNEKNFEVQRPFRNIITNLKSYSEFFCDIFRVFQSNLVIKSGYREKSFQLGVFKFDTFFRKFQKNRSNLAYSFQLGTFQLGHMYCSILS